MVFHAARRHRAAGSSLSFSLPRTRRCTLPILDLSPTVLPKDTGPEKGSGCNAILGPTWALSPFFNDRRTLRTGYCSRGVESAVVSSVRVFFQRPDRGLE